MPALFEANCARLTTRDPRLAASLRQAESAAVARETLPRGRTRLRIGGVQLASAYDPKDEARRGVAELLSREPDLVVVVGFGLGHAVEAIRDVSRASVLVYEPALDRLRAAFECRDLPCLSESDLFWSASLDELARQFRALYTAGLRVEVWIHPVAKRLDAEAVAEGLRRIAAVKRSAEIADRTRVQKSASFAEQSVDNLEGMLATPPLSALEGLFKGFPAVVVAAGPSLDRQIETLRALGDRALVIAIGQSLPALQRNGIRPHLTHIVESQDVSHQLQDGGSSCDADLVVIPSVHPALFRVPVASRFVAYPIPNGIAQWFGDCFGEGGAVGGAPTVAQSAVYVAAALGANPVLLVGQDLAFSGGRVYAADSAYEMVSFREVGEGRFVYTGEDDKAQLLNQAPRGPQSGQADLVWVPSWEGDDAVPTSPQYAAFIDHYAEVARSLATAGVEIINCTEGGARISALSQAPFAETLQERVGDVVPRDAIRERYHQFERRDPALLRAGWRAMDRRIQHLGRLRVRAERQLHRTARDARAGAPAARVAGALRRLGATEGRLAHAIEAIPWLDMVSQRETQRAALALHRTRELPPVEAAIEEGETLVEVARASEEESRALLERLGQRLDALGAVRS